MNIHVEVIRLKEEIEKLQRRVAELEKPKTPQPQPQPVRKAG